MLINVGRLPAIFVFLSSRSHDHSYLGFSDSRNLTKYTLSLVVRDFVEQCFSCPIFRYVSQTFFFNVQVKTPRETLKTTDITEENKETVSRDYNLVHVLETYTCWCTCLYKYKYWYNSVVT